MESLCITSLSQLAKLSEVPLKTLRGLIAMTESPCRKNGEWRDPVVKLAGFFGCTVLDLFTEEQRLVLGFNRLVAEITHDEMRSSEKEVDESMHPDMIASAMELHRAIRKIVMDLPLKEQRVIRMRFGFDGGVGITRKDVAVLCDVGERRIRTIEAKALKKLCQPLFQMILEEAGAQDVRVRDALQHTNASV